ncbi:hypothetical protein Mpsy_1090 [Methanolobus psychrophilus R15]|nr:hypothetical protein Mpsy_1090 [Methanolobus psychrophilus R15]
MVASKAIVVSIRQGRGCGGYLEKEQALSIVNISSGSKYLSYATLQ